MDTQKLLFWLASAEITLEFFASVFYFLAWTTSWMWDPLALMGVLIAMSGVDIILAIIAVVYSFQKTAIKKGMQFYTNHFFIESYINLVNMIAAIIWVGRFNSSVGNPNYTDNGLTFLFFWIINLSAFIGVLFFIVDYSHCCQLHTLFMRGRTGTESTGRKFNMSSNIYSQ